MQRSIRSLFPILRDSVRFDSRNSFVDEQQYTRVYDEYRFSTNFVLILNRLLLSLLYILITFRQMRTVVSGIPLNGWKNGSLRGSLVGKKREKISRRDPWDPLAVSVYLGLPQNSPKLVFLTTRIPTISNLWTAGKICGNIICHGSFLLFTAKSLLQQPVQKDPWLEFFHLLYSSLCALHL